MSDINTPTSTQKSKYKFRYICVSQCKRLALEIAKTERQFNGFSRVSEDFLISCEAAITNHIRSRIKAHPSKGKTLTWWQRSAIFPQRMIAYKLFRKRKDGSYGPLFINRTLKITADEWLPAEAHRTKGYAFRPGWHCCSTPNAPHLSMTGRVWCEVEIKFVEKLNRPASQGGTWYLAKHLKLVRELWMPT